MLELKKIGKGGFSGCYLNRDQDQYVYKVFDKASNKYNNEMVNNEIAIYKRINNQSQYIVHYHGSNVSKQHVSLKLEKCHSDLSNLKKNIRLDDGDVINIMWQVLQGLSVLHGNDIIHCDIKPNNLLMNFDESGRYIIKICDFGLSQIGGGYSQYIKGTELYIDPATIRGNIICQRSDMWAFGITILLFYFPNSTMGFLKTKELKGDINDIMAKLNKRIQTIQNNFIKYSLTNCLQIDYKKRISSQQLLEIMQQAISQKDIQIQEQFNKQLQLRNYWRINHIAANKLAIFIGFDCGYQCLYIKKLQQNITFDKISGDIYTYPLLNREQFNQLLPELSKISKKYDIKGQFKLAAVKSPILQQFKQEKNIITFIVSCNNTSVKYKYDIIEQKTMVVLPETCILLQANFAINASESKYK